MVAGSSPVQFYGIGSSVGRALIMYPVKKTKHRKRRFSFGKYKGKTIELIIKKDPNYINWLLKNAIKGFSLTPKEKKLFNYVDSYTDIEYDEGDNTWYGLTEEDLLGHYPGDG